MCDRVELKDEQIVKSECVWSSLFLFYTLALSLLAFESFLKGLSGRTNKSPPVFYTTLSLLGPLPCFPSLQFTITQSRATGIADHILPLGDLFLPRRHLLRHSFIFSRCIIVTMTCTRPIRFILAPLESSNLRVINAAACIVTLYCSMYSCVFL